MSEAIPLKERVATVLANEVAPLLRMAGSGVEVLDVQDGIVQVRLTGACTGCPSSIQSVVFGLEQELRRRIPEVEYLEVVP